jgi:hypothetical protein
MIIEVLVGGILALKRLEESSFVVVPGYDISLVHLAKTHSNRDISLDLLDDFVQLLQTLLLLLSAASDINNEDNALGSFELLFPKDALPLSSRKILNISTSTKKATERLPILTSSM